MKSTEKNVQNIIISSTLFQYARTTLSYINNYLKSGKKSVNNGIDDVQPQEAEAQNMQNQTTKQMKPSTTKLSLATVLTKIDDAKIMLNFLKDITTPQEFSSMQERLDIASLLHSGISYRQISEKTGAGLATVTRVARFLKQEENGGYRHVLENSEKFGESESGEEK